MKDKMQMKKRMAFIDNSNFKDWPMGGMLEYELSILRYLIREYDLDLWGVSVDGVVTEYVQIGDIQKKVNIFGNVHTKNKIIPNYLLGIKIAHCKEFKQQDYDIIYAHTGSCFVGACKVVDKNKTILAYHQHGLSYKTNKSLMVGIQKPFYRKSQKLADVVFVVSDQESVDKHVQELEWDSKNKFISIGSPIDTDRFDRKTIEQRIKKGHGDREMSFLYVGRLSSEKNIPAMIEAFSIYHRVDERAILNLVGDGPERENIEKMVSSLKLKKNVIFHGAVKHADVYPYLMNADIFLITSNGEGVSIAVLEAFAAGLPVVCFKVPGLEKQNIDGFTGIVVNEHTAEAYSKAMQSVAEKKDFYANNCMVEAEKYDYRIISEKISEAINKIRK